LPARQDLRVQGCYGIWSRPVRLFREVADYAFKPRRNPGLFFNPDISASFQGAVFWAAAGMGSIAHRNNGHEFSLGLTEEGQKIVLMR